MESFVPADILPGQDYHGTILLSKEYSAALRERLAECIRCYRAFENTGSAAMLYIAAWKGNDRKIWYEYAGKNFISLFGCRQQDIGEIFPGRVIGRRIYRNPDIDIDAAVPQESRSHDELSDAWEALREEGKQTGTLEAVYNVRMDLSTTIWLKDQATIEVFDRDDICLSFGLLTLVSKEMEAEEKLKRHHGFLEDIIAARTDELTRLNAQLQQEIDERRFTQIQLKDSYVKLQQSLDKIVNAMSLTLEERDPYTAGHQRRTTGLSLAIAREMGLPEHETKGLQMAGLIHDMGKISVPGEILSKPGPLNEAELLLIRRHPQVAYEILKQVDFPWPVDLIVLQHHEKMNGSGYPQGLSGDQILLESRILCVADVVETMETHRPYRPSLGREAALLEISRNSAVLYDPDVVAVCLRLFQEMDFQYPTAI